MSSSKIFSAPGKPALYLSRATITALKSAGFTVDDAPEKTAQADGEALDGNHIGTTATERFNSSGWRLSRHRPGKDPDTIGRSQLRRRARAIGLEDPADIDNLIGGVLVLDVCHEEGKQLKKDGTPFVYLRFKNPAPSMQSP